jgi:hypothetical protein
MSGYPKRKRNNLRQLTYQTSFYLQNKASILQGGNNNSFEQEAMIMKKG